jgi:hypothetical protein
MPFDAMPERNNDGELLYKAKTELVRRCWVKGQYTDAGRICSVVALAFACDNRRFRRPTRLQRQLAGHLVRELPNQGGIILRWCTTAYFRVMLYNDSSSTRYDDVVRMYDRAILRQDEESVTGWASVAGSV